MTRRWIVVSATVVSLIAALVVVALNVPSRGADAATLSASDAVGLAIRYAETPTPTGWLITAPTQANAQLTSYGAAVQLKDGRPLQSGTKLAQQSGRPVWLVFLRGDAKV